MFIINQCRQVKYINMQRKNTHIVSVVTSAEARSKEGERVKGVSDCIHKCYYLKKKRQETVMTNMAWRKYGMYSICYTILQFGSFVNLKFSQLLFFVFKDKISGEF